MPNLNETTYAISQIEVKAFLKHIALFRKYKVLALVESLLKEGFGSFLQPFTKLTTANKQVFLYELLRIEHSIKNIFSKRISGTFNNNKANQIGSINGLVSYLKLTRSLVHNTLNETANKSNKSNINREGPTQTPPPSKLFYPPRYDLDSLQYAKDLFVLENSSIQAISKISNQPTQKKISVSQNYQSQNLTKYARKFSEFKRFEEVGIHNLSEIGLILVAGGLGERMQGSINKVDRKMYYFNHDQVYDHSFFEYYLEIILALQEHYYERTGKTTTIPLFVMCAEHNYLSVKAVIKRYTKKARKITPSSSKKWGLIPGQVMVYRQLMAPCFGKEGGLIFKNGKLVKKPLGHGFVHTLIHRYNYLATLRAQKKRYLFFLQDTNPQIVNTLVSSLGMVVSHRSYFLWINAKRHIGEEAGIITGETIRHNKSTVVKRVINIEYHDLPDSHILQERGLKKKQDIEHQLFANTNNFWIDVHHYEKILHKTRGILPFVVNPKFGVNGTMKSIRPESLMQDITKYVVLTRRVLAKKNATFNKKVLTKEPPKITALTHSITTVTYPRYFSFSPVKKPLRLDTTNIANSAKKLKSTAVNQMSRLPLSWEYTSLELDINHNFSTIEAIAKKNTIIRHKYFQSSKSFSGQDIISYWDTLPRVVLSASYLLSKRYLSEHIVSSTFHPRSITIIGARSVFLKNVTILPNAALIVSVSPKVIASGKPYGLVLNDLTIVNDGFTYVPLSKLSKSPKHKHKEFNEESSNRGYAIEWKNPLVLEITQSGYYCFDGQSLKTINSFPL